MSFFYVLYIRESPLSDYLEAIRLLANPAEKSAAHITVRGPYSHPAPLRKIRDRLKGQKITVSSVGHFFGAGQRTVYWRCYSPRLESVWKKSDFGFNPHITVYDGDSTRFARELFRIMNRHRFDFQFRAGQLELYPSRRRQTGFQLHLFYNEQLVSEVLGERISARKIASLSAARRLRYINQLCIHLSHCLRPIEATQLSLV